MSNPETQSPDTESGFLRLAYMLGYGLIAYVLFWLILFSAGVQIVVRLVTGAPNQELVELALRMTTYIGELLGYITFQTEEKPFPFNNGSTDVTVSKD